MTRADIIRMAQEAGAIPSGDPREWDVWLFQDPAMENFAALVIAEKDREILALRTENERLNADAERYRLLKSRVENYDGYACFPEIPYPAPIPDCSPFDAIDAAVDEFFKQAALRRENET